MVILRQKFRFLETISHFWYQNFLRKNKYFSVQIFFLFNVAKGQLLGLIWITWTYFRVSDEHFSLIFQVPGCSKKQLKYFFELAIGSIRGVSEQNSSNTGLMLDKHKHLALFDSLEVHSFATSDNLCDLRPIDVEKVIDSSSDPR